MISDVEPENPVLAEANQFLEGHAARSSNAHDRALVSEHQDDERRDSDRGGTDRHDEDADGAVVWVDRSRHEDGESKAKQEEYTSGLDEMLHMPCLCAGGAFFLHRFHRREGWSYPWRYLTVWQWWTM